MPAADENVSGAEGSLPSISEGAAPAIASHNVPQVEGYRVLAPLGRGGMGTVWRALQLSTNRHVALKLMNLPIHSADQAISRFQREVELSARLAHPNIARIYDSGMHHGVYFYAMELIDGVPLD